MAKYKSLAKPTKKSPAAKQAEQRQKALKQVSSGKYAKGVKTLSASSDKSRRMTSGEKRIATATPFTPKQVPQPPRTAKMDKGVSLTLLIKNTPRLMRENGDECYVRGYKKTKTGKALPVVMAKVRHKDPLRPSKEVREYEVMFVGLDDPNKPISKQKRVMVSCPCANYVFMWEYANAEHGAGRIIYGNGEPPDYTNPAHVPALCKHAMALAKRIKTNGD